MPTRGTKPKDHAQEVYDGTITGMDEAVDAVAEAHPYLVRDDLAEDDEDWEPPDLPSGWPTNGRRGLGATRPAQRLAYERTTQFR